jgi:hypothetical protein
MSRACRPARRVRRLLTLPRTRRGQSSCCCKPARSASARPISINSPRGSRALARRTVRAVRLATRSTYQGDRVRAPPPLSRRVMWRSASAPTPADRAASQPASTALSASSRRLAVFRRGGWCLIVPRLIASRSLQRRSMTGCRSSRSSGASMPMIHLRGSAPWAGLWTQHQPRRSVRCARASRPGMVRHAGMRRPI